jgi:type VI secretion system protein ImpA
VSEALLDLEALLKPIPGENSAGTDLRYDSLYGEIKAARLGDEANDIKPDWPRVEKLAATALEKNSKDLQLGVWLLEALTRQHDFAGTATGLTCLARVTEAYWECLYPPTDPEDDEPLAYRAGVMSWVADKLAPILKSVPLTQDGYTLLHYEVTQKTGEEKQALLQDGWPSWEQFEQSTLAFPLEYWEELLANVKACQEALTELEKVCNERFVVTTMGGGKERTERILGFHLLKDLLENAQWLAAKTAKKKREEQTSPERPEAVVEEQPSPEASVQETAPAAEETTATAVPAARPKTRMPGYQPATPEEAFQIVTELARYLRDDNPYRPIPYLLIRALAWGHLVGFENIADAASAGPTSEVRKKLKELYQQADWTGLLNESENALGEEANRTWVDLYRYGLQALQNLGYERAALAVRAMLRFLLQTHPGLLDLELADGTPAAGPESRKWIKEEGLLEPETPAQAHAEPPVEAPGEPVSAGTGVQAGPDGQAVWDEAVARLKKRDFAGGLKLLQARSGEASSGRERFMRRLEMAEFCLLGSRQNLAFPILDDLVRTVDEFHLEEWEEKELITRTWIGFVRCCQKLDSTDEKKQRAGEIFDRLCRLDITKALSLEK